MDLWIDWQVDVPQEEQKEVVELPLLTSYRSSPEITGLFSCPERSFL